MSNVQKHFEKVAYVDQNMIPDGQKIVYIASQGSLPGQEHDTVVLPVHRKIACRQIAKGTHRLATKEEIAAHDQAEEETKQDVLSKREMPITADTIAQVAMAVQRKSNADKKKETN
jgi:hypothetical protein